MKAFLHSYVQKLLVEIEALIGAIYLDKGYLMTHNYIENTIFRNFIDITEVVTVDKNYKSRLIEWAQKNRKEVKFNTSDLGIVNEQKSPMFEAIVNIDNSEVGRGEGTSKKEAQQNAAKKAVEYLQKRENIKF